MDAQPAAPAAPNRLELFEDRYGPGAHARLLALLRQPCLSFAEIASRFGVTRECVRQWHQRLLPDAPTGHARQRLCRLAQRLQRLLADPLIARFVAHLRRTLPDRRVALIPARGGYRTRLVSLDGQVVALRRARIDRRISSQRGSAWLLTAPAGAAAFVYFEITARDYLLIPRALLATRETRLAEGDAQWSRYRNTFNALLDAAHDSRSGGSGAATADRRAERTA